MIALIFSFVKRLSEGKSNLRNQRNHLISDFLFSTLQKSRLTYKSFFNFSAKTINNEKSTCSCDCLFLLICMQ